MITPYENTKESKKEQVAQMFDNIAPKYDFLNHFLSLGIDIYWRKRAIKLLGKHLSQRSSLKFVDVATGTGDLAVELLKLDPTHVYGIDIANQMLELGRKKVRKKGLQDKITFQEGDASQIPFDDTEFDAATVAFGVRNFEHLDKGLAEMYRVLADKGVLIVLEFSKPKTFPFKQVFQAYFRYILPKIGKIVSGNAVAYDYLPKSVMAFPEGNAFLEKLQEAGFRTTEYHTLTLGVCSIYVGIKNG